jgi:hypothetical protein
LNVALTDCAALIVTVHVAAVPLQPPPFQPANVEPLLGVAVNVTEAPELKFAEHVAPQLTPPVLLVTAPPPDPAGVTANAYVISVNAAVTDCAALIVTVQVIAVPVQPPPLQPANVDPLFGVSAKVTAVPEL